MNIIKAVKNENNRKVLSQRPHGTEKAATSFDVLIKLDNFRAILDLKFKGMKRKFMWKLRILYQTEQNILKEKQPLMLRTLRLNEENLYKHIRFARKGGNQMNPRKFLRMINGKNVHEEDQYLPNMKAFFKLSYFRNFMAKLRKNRVSAKSSSTLLLTGVWNNPQPYLRFREYYVCRIFQKNYIKCIWLTYLKFQQHRKISNYVDQSIEQ